jgi:hypothetical protein
MTSLRRRQLAVAVLAVVTGIGVLVVMINGRHNNHRGAYAALALGIGWGFIGTGLYVWRRRPQKQHRSADDRGRLQRLLEVAGLLQ